MTYETVRQWCLRFGLEYARRLWQRRGRLGDTWHLDELFVSTGHLQRFASVHGVVQNLFRVGRHLLRAADHRLLRTRAFSERDVVTCAC